MTNGLKNNVHQLTEVCYLNNCSKNSRKKKSMSILKCSHMTATILLIIEIANWMQLVKK